MSNHMWGDDWEYWPQLYRAIHEILEYWRKYRLGSHGKEKYGTFRDHIWWSDGTLYSLVYPGYVWIRPSWQWFYYNIDYPIIKRVMLYSGMWFLLNRYQRRVYRRGIELAIQRYPEVREELIEDLDYPELIKRRI